MRRHLPAFAVILAVLACPAAAAQDASTEAAVAAFAARDTSALVLDGVAVAGPIVLTPRPPEDIPPSLHEQIRHLKARLDNAYPDASDARKLAFIADYLGISFRRLWNAYHPDRPQPPVITARPIDARPVDGVRPVERVRPGDIRVRPAPVARPAARPAVRPRARG